MSKKRGDKNDVDDSYKKVSTPEKVPERGRMKIQTDGKGGRHARSASGSSKSGLDKKQKFAEKSPSLSRSKTQGLVKPVNAVWPISPKGGTPGANQKPEKTP